MRTLTSARVRVLLVAVALLSTVALTQSGNGYDLSWHTVDSGGYTFSSGGPYGLGWSVGQPDAGQLTGGDYTLGGGFWRGGAMMRTYRVYLPLALRGH